MRPGPLVTVVVLATGCGGGAGLEDEVAGSRTLDRVAARAGGSPAEAYLVARCPREDAVCRSVGPQPSYERPKRVIDVVGGEKIVVTTGARAAAVTARADPQANDALSTTLRLRPDAARQRWTARLPADLLAVAGVTIDVRPDAGSPRFNSFTLTGDGASG